VSTGVIETGLSPVEQELLDRLPGPPPGANIRTNEVWILEWLHPQDRMTGRQLHNWLQHQRPSWSMYVSCGSKAEILAALATVTNRARQSNLIPLLHIEAHGDEDGLEGPDGTGGADFLCWEELADPLQQLNLATACNLVVFIAACTGFAGIKAFYRGPRAPAVALVGPVDRIMDGDLLRGTKEFYRRYRDPDPRLIEVVANASNEAGAVGFELEPFAVLAFEAMAQVLIVSLRHDERSRRAEKLRRRMQATQQLANSEIERQLSILPVIPSAADLQLQWNRLFMIDLWPENHEKFGVDMALVRETLLAGEQPLLLPSS